MSASSVNIKLIQDIYAAFGRGDIAAVMAGLDADIEWVLLASSRDIPCAGRRRGHAGVAEFFRILGESADLLEFSPREFHSTDSKVFVLGHERARVKKTQAVYAIDWLQIFTVISGKVARFQEFYDTAAVAAAFRS